MMEGIESVLEGLGVEWDRQYYSSNPTKAAGYASGAFILDSKDIPAYVRDYDAVLCSEAAGAEKQVLDLEARGFPLVVINDHRDLPVSVTCLDHKAIFRSAVDLLVNLGHRRIALLSREPEFLYYGKAHEGYLEGLAEVGIPRDDRLIVDVTSNTDAISAFLAVRPLIESDQRPTAIMAAKDCLAEGACRAMREAGLTPGRDISIVGFDDNSWGETPSFLTTFSESCHEMGAQAAEMVVERLLNGLRPPERRVVDAPLILRQSAFPFLENGALRGSRGMVLVHKRNTGAPNPVHQQPNFAPF
jgi:DNA-binding LacI/PurR family transcriptional regulator